MITIAPTKDELIATARELRPMLLERSACTEQERRLPQETVDAMRSAGFFNFNMPKRWGGSGGSLGETVEIAAELAKGCPSTAWVFMITVVLTGFAGSYLPEVGSRAIVESMDDPIVCGVNGFTGYAKPFGDGYLVSGSWGFASGSLHSHWFMGGVLLRDENGQVINQGWAFMPMPDLSIKDTWHVAGMRGTGSNTVICENAFVPEHLMMTMADRMAQEADPLPGAEAIDRMPFAALFSVGLLGPCLGAAEAACELVSRNASTRGISYFEFAKQTDSGGLMERLGIAKMKIDTAWLHIRRAASTLHDDTIDGPLEYKIRARCRADAAHAAENLRSAMDLLLSIGGASSFADSNPLQRYWRDLSVGSRHAFLNTGPLYEAYSKADLGVEPNVTVYV